MVAHVSTIFTLKKEVKVDMYINGLPGEASGTAARIAHRTSAPC